MITPIVLVSLNGIKVLKTDNYNGFFQLLIIIIILRYSIEDDNVFYNISVNEKLSLPYITTKIKSIRLFLIVKPLLAVPMHR